MNRRWDSRLDALGVRLESPANASYRLIEATWVSQTEAGDKHHIYVRVVDGQGKPVEGHSFRVANGGVAVERTKGPGFDDFYGNFPMFAGGRYAVDIPDGVSDKITGLSMGMTGDPYANACFYLSFQQTAGTDTSQSEPHPGDGKSALDAETRAQLLALLDRAQAELTAARALLEVE